MKRIYLYFKERTEKGEFTSRGIQILFFWGLGLFSTIWFLVRVIPKPSRASYPCMQTAAPLMSAFVMYLLSFTGVWVSLRQLREAFRNRKVVVGVFAFAGFCFFGALMLVENSTDMLAQTFFRLENRVWHGVRIIRWGRRKVFIRVGWYGLMRRVLLRGRKGRAFGLKIVGIIRQMPTGF